jgi:hypothetical protein
VNEVLKLTRQQQLAKHTCPACFGGSTNPNKPADQPLIVCLDGNFQQRHHAAASRNYQPLLTPSKFIAPEAITAMDRHIQQQEQHN